MKPPVTKKEAKAIAACLVSIGSPSPMLLIQMFGIPKKRVEQLLTKKWTKADDATLTKVLEHL